MITIRQGKEPCEEYPCFIAMEDEIISTNIFQMGRETEIRFDYDPAVFRGPLDSNLLQKVYEKEEIRLKKESGLTEEELKSRETEWEKKIQQTIDNEIDGYDFKEMSRETFVQKCLRKFRVDPYAMVGEEIDYSWDVYMSAQWHGCNKVSDDDMNDPDYEHCYECRGLGDDYRIGDDGELESCCDTCPFNPDRPRDE